MGFLATLREKIADAVSHRPIVCADPVLGQLEEIGGGLWQTRQPVILHDGIEPVNVTIETEILGEIGAGTEGRSIFLELRRRYPQMREEIGKLLCSVEPRVKADRLWNHASLESIEIWREPRSAKPVLALEYVISDSPEYTYTVRVEDWHALDVVISG